MDQAVKKKLYEQLSAPVGVSDTGGVTHQFVVRRLNSVLGLGGFRVHREVSVKTVHRDDGPPMFEGSCDLTLELGEWVNGCFVTIAESVADGGHMAASEADAKTGAFIDAFKKAAAFHGVGDQVQDGEHRDTIPSATMPSAASNVVSLPSVDRCSIVVVRAPLPTPPLASAVAVTGNASQQADRTRLSPKQLAAIWSIARKLNVETSVFRTEVKQRFGAQLEFLTRQQASELIDSLHRQRAENRPLSQHGVA